MELQHVKGLGPGKIEAFKAAGIDDVEELAAVDLRRAITVEGVSGDALKTYKARARAVLQKEALVVPKAAYRRKTVNRGKTRTPQPGQAQTTPPRAHAVTKKRWLGLLGRKRA